MRRFAAVAATMAVASLTLAAVPVAPADASSTTVVITSPFEGATLSGTVTVSATITADPDNPPYAADVALDVLSKEVPIPEGSCPVTCTVSATFDTVANGDPGIDSAQPDRTVADGPTQVMVQARDRSSYPDARTSVIVDNDRPTVAAPDLPAPSQNPYVTQGLTADEQLVLRLYPRVPAGSTATIDHIDVHSHNGPTHFPAATIPAPADGDPWVYVADTSDQAPGYFSVHATAYDTRGTPSATLMVPVVVDHGPTIQVAALPDPLPASWIEGVNITTTAVYTAWVTSSEVLLDGNRLSRYDFCCTQDRTKTFSQGFPGETLLPAGHHVLRVRVSDNRGVTNSVDLPVTIDPGPTVTWTSGAGGSVAHGSTVDLRARLSAVHGRVTGWALHLDDSSWYSPGCEGTTCPITTTAAGRWKATLPVGEHTVLLVYTSSTGFVHRLTRTIRVYPGGTVSIATPVAVTYGTGFTVSGTARTRDGKPLPGATVAVQRRAAGTATWRTYRTVTTSSTGGVRVRMGGTVTSGAWRLALSGKPNAWSAATSATRTVSVRAKVAAYRPATGATVNRSVTFQVRSAPYEQNLSLRLQLRRPRGAWHTVRSPRVQPDGRSFATISFPKRGTWYVRAIRPATTRIATGTSPRWTVTVG